jgi:hypothetical protein
MKKFFTPSSYRMVGLILGMVVWLANSFNPPNAHTGAPFDSSCGNCHGGGGLNGTVTLSGLPGTIQANTTYNLTLTMTPTGGNPNRGGFQLVAVDNNNANAGNLISVNGQTGTENAGGREYIEHRGTKTFGGSPISWDFDWTAPAAAAGNTIKFYFIGNFTNGNGGTSGDNAFDELNTFAFQPGASPVSASISSFENVSCNGGNDGSITAQGAGGTPPYSYSWNNGQTTQTAINLSVGNYSVTISDQAGSTGVASRTLTQPTALNVLTSVSGVITCSNPSATVSASTTGGVSPYQYGWSTGDNGPSVQVSSPGIYTVTATDANGCIKTGQVTVNGNLLAPSAAASTPGALTCVASSVTLSGSGSSQGANFIYSWTTTNGNIVSGANTLNPVVNAAGNYTLTVINTINGCTSTASTTVASNFAQPTASALADGKRTCTDTIVTLSASATPNSTFSWRNANNVVIGTGSNVDVQTPGVYTVIATAQNNGCKDTAAVTVQTDTIRPTASTTNGSITCIRSEDTLTVKSGAGTSYLWAGPGNFVSVEDSIAADTQGLYIVTITGTNGCTTLDTAILSLDTIHPALAVTNGELSCLSPSDELVAFSDSVPVLYSWTGPNGFVQTSNMLVIYDTVTVTATGLYLVTATSENGCTTVDTAVVSQNPSLTTQLVSKNNVSCFGGNDGSATVSVGGGLAPYNVTWSNNAIGNTINNLPAGQYVWTATDAAGCSISGTVAITQPALLAANATATQETANGANNGTATAQPVGGTAPYTYAWSNGETTQTITSLPPASYTVTVKDANNCTAVQTATVNAFNCSISADVAVTDVTCFGGKDGSISLSVNTPNTPVQYIWSNGETSASISNLGAGVFAVTATDAASCVVQRQNIVVLQPAVADTAFLQATTCDPDQAGVEVSMIIDANGCISFVAQETILLPNNETNFFEVTCDSAALGVFTSVYANQFGCDSTVTLTVTYEPSPLDVSLDFLNNDVNNSGAGSVGVMVVNSSQNVNYEWFKDGAAFPGNTAVLNGLFAGQYTVVVTDEISGCSKSFGPIDVQNTVATSNPSELYGIRTMPNPVTSELRVQWGTFLPQSARIYDNQGRLCTVLTQNMLSLPIETSQLPSGWYVMHVQDETGGNVLLRFAKQSH